MTEIEIPKAYDIVSDSMVPVTQAWVDAQGQYARLVAMSMEVLRHLLSRELTQTWTLDDWSALQRRIQARSMEGRKFNE